MMTHRTILIAAGIYPPDVGGPATYSKLLADELPKHGIEVQVFTFGSVRHLPKIVRHIAYFFKTLIQGRKADIIYAQDAVSVGLPSLCAARLLGKRFFLRLGGDYAWEQGVARFGVKESLDEFVTHNGTYPFPVFALKAIQTYVASNAEKVIVPSQYLATIVQAWEANKKEKKIRIHAVYNACIPIFISESKDDLRKILALQGEVILSAGRLVSWKGFGMLIEIMPLLRKHIPNATLLIAGEGPERSRLEKCIEEGDASSYVRLLGVLSKEKLAKYIKASDVFALNTGYEGFSHQLLEVMACRTPIVTTDIAGNKELIENGVSGILLKYNDKEGFITALANVIKEKNTEMANQAYKKVQKFTLEHMIEETIEALNI